MSSGNNFKNKLAMFEKRASDATSKPSQNPIRYNNVQINKSKILNIFQKAQEEQRQKNNKLLTRTKTESTFTSQYKSDNVEKFKGYLIKKRKEEEEKNEQIQKEIHETKKVNNKAIKDRIEQTIEDKLKIEENRKNEIKKKKEQENNFTFDINKTLVNINNIGKNSYNYDTFKASENIKKNTKLLTQIDNNLKKIFGDDLDKKKLTFEEKYHYFDRKINNLEEKEKINLIVTIKNPKPEYEYSSKIYDDNKTLIAESGKEKGENEIILYNKLIIDYYFSKKTSHIYEIIKTIQDQKEIKSEMNIPLNKILSSEENKNYEEKIENFDDNEKINIGFEPNISINQDEKEKDIQLFFQTKNNLNDSSNFISYSIQKENKIIYKSPLCNCSHIKQSDKLPINILNQEFEISFYNKNYDEQKISINTEQLLNQKSMEVSLELPETEKLDIVISIEQFDKISLLKLKKDGLNINLSIAIDFTSSNGYPQYSDSLHYVGDGYINNYEKSIRACADILSIYNKNDEYDVYGFGADLNGKFMRCFNIKKDNNDENDKIKGIENVIKEYKKTLHEVELSGGTYFAPVIKTINEKISKNNSKLKYNILLIISDGEVHDIQDIIDNLIESAQIPLSIVIIGVGGDVTEDMKRLNGENGKLRDYKGKYLEKDIVQYVHFNDYNENIDKLTQEVFRYIPQQIKDYYQNIDKFDK